MERTFIGSKGHAEVSAACGSASLLEFSSLFRPAPRASCSSDSCAGAQPAALQGFARAAATQLCAAHAAQIPFYALGSHAAPGCAAPLLRREACAIAHPRLARARAAGPLQVTSMSIAEEERARAQPHLLVRCERETQ
jgi:hypothetical protein